LLLMACLMRFGALPQDARARERKLAEYQAVFDTH
jgi:hypothetical protein